MKQNNTQRGMKKWMPFNALEHYDDYIHSVYEIRNRIEKPILSEEQIEELNESLVKYNHDEVEVTYFKQGEIKKIQGFINKIDTVNKSITISNIKILFSNLLKIHTLI